jgi:hypothetical protein
MMKSDAPSIGDRFKRAQIGLKDTLAVIDMMLGDDLADSSDLPAYGVFEGLNELIDRTVHGTKIERFGPKADGQPFHTFEIRTGKGEALGYLNMIYFRKPISCYYLVYVEILVPFRGRGLGHQIIKAFKDFVECKAAVGVLDNIIPPEDPTYTIYSKLGWKDIQTLIGESVTDWRGRYMVFVPRSVKNPILQDKLIKLLFRVRKKRPVIDMHDNEAMVKRTIAEFRSVYQALESLFDEELSKGRSTPLMRFMFTRFVVKVLGFRRRIATLLGYTGGESLEQISISDQAKELPIQTYSLWGSTNGQATIWEESRPLISRACPFTGAPICLRG